MAVQNAVAPGRKGIWLSLLGLWVVLVVFGSTKLELFASTPGLRATGASGSAGGGYHLYVFLHPLCPCSNASISELHRLVDHSPSKVDVTAVIDCAGLQSGAAQHLVTSLTASPGIAVEVDGDGTRTASYGARTSGQVLLYDSSGALAFSGGITGARAHEGDNAGETAILDIINGRTPSTRNTPVFGCALSQSVTKQ